MAGAKEIRTKIRSIKNTQKITRAMEMVAASKMRKAQERMHALKSLCKKNSYGDWSCSKQCHSEYRHPYLQTRDIKRVGFIIVTTDRGLCGGLNANLLKTAIACYESIGMKKMLKLIYV